MTFDTMLPFRKAKFISFLIVSHNRRKIKKNPTASAIGFFIVFR